MATLAAPLRTLLENTVKRARAEAVKASRAALTALAVDREEPFAGMTEADRGLRRMLREKERQLGEFDALVQAVAYEQWHRMLFARFLAENELLMHREHEIAVTLAECAELAVEENEPDGWMVAAKYAAKILPGIFRTEDPLQQVRFAAEGRQALERLLDALPSAVFLADDSLGWVYQFWQSEMKAEVNRSGRKIGGADIPPVTQLFTEPYMVEFLLHNTLGAWWAARHPDDDLVATFTYLRVDEDGTPIAGRFIEWPEHAADLRVLDPCCGSGHFLVAAFDMLREMRMREEHLNFANAGDGVLRDNLFGLEIDTRCTEIAAFALALAAWKVSGYRRLPIPHVACSGIPVGDRIYDWTSIAGGDFALESNLRTLYTLFQQAQDFGSLIDIARVDEQVGQFWETHFEDVLPHLERILTSESTRNDPTAAIFGEVIASTARTALLLAGQYHLVITNPPFLGGGNQGAILSQFLATRYPEGKADIATAFVERCRGFCVADGTYAMVTPQNWLFLGSYKKLRERLLKEQTWQVVGRLGPQSFQTPMWDFNVSLLIFKNARPAPDNLLAGLDASEPRIPAEKAALLRNGDLAVVPQASQLGNPDARIVFDIGTQGDLLKNYATALAGCSAGDKPRFIRMFWEVPRKTSEWEWYQSSVSVTCSFGGRSEIIFWEQERGTMFHLAQSVRHLNNAAQKWLGGKPNWGKRGVVVSQMGQLPATLYLGDRYDNNCTAIVPSDQNLVSAIWAFCSSPAFNKAVRRINQKISVTDRSYLNVPFDLERWQAIADASGPLPEPYSNDSTQWLFNGYPVGSTDPLQVAVARLLGYRWPEQQDDNLNGYVDADGIVCLPSVRGEQPATDRVRTLLAAAYGDNWSFPVHEELLAAVGFAGKELDAWLRDGFWAQHCSCFRQRPFIWHIWDGRKDGFSALVNYHTLDRQKLERLTYTYLNDWLARQRAAIEAMEPGADGRLVAAQQLQEKLQAILDGEPPYDIYVRWKPLAKQPIGWEPDLNDGVRMNIRPFVEAGVLRGKVNINWKKDRGTNPDGTERHNDLHFTRAEKEAARRMALAGARS